MKLPYRYRGVTLLALLVVVLPWATWRFALYDTFAAWCDCRRLMRELKVTTPRNHGLQSFDGVCTDAPELIFSGGLLDSLRRYAVGRSVQVIGYEPQVTDRRDGIALHAVCVTLAGRFGDLLRTTHALEHCLAFCRVRSMAWTVRTDRRTKRKDLILTLYLEQLVTDRQ